MITFICLFFPAVLTVGVYETAGRVKLSRKVWLYRYCASNLFVNLLCFAVKHLILGTSGAPFYTLYADVTPAAAFNYLVMAIPSAIVLAFVQILLTKHAKIAVEDKQNDKDEI